MLKGFILAAGYGSRLQPLTCHTPKPLLPCMGVPNILLAIETLRTHGIKSIGINTHHLAEQFPPLLGGMRQLKIFKEETLLGSAGFARNLSDWLQADEHLLIYNGDIVSNIDLALLMDTHLRQNAYATITLLPKHLPNQTCVYTQSEQVRNFLQEQQEDACSFAGAQVWSPAFRHAIVRHQHIDMLTAYRHALAQQQKIAYHLHHDLWFDLGTAADFFRAHLALQQRLQTEPSFLALRSFLAHELRAHPSYTSVGSPAVGANCLLKPPVFLLHSDIQLAAGTELESCLVMGKTTVRGKHKRSLFLDTHVLRF